ncbi:asparagine synthase-related protein [Pseudomonas cedrina]|uniref:asparagine synthase-related protein n=1 Tax=Pseudomonas cedrina TaxID=651740 RepID=UPI003EDA2677
MHFMIELNGRLVNFSNTLRTNNELYILQPSACEKNNILLKFIESGKTILTITPCDVIVEHDCHHQLFTYNSPSSRYISSSLIEIVEKTNTKIKLDMIFFATYIICGSHPSTRSPFEKISYLGPGSTINIRLGSISEHQWKSTEPREFLDCIESYLDKNIPDKEVVGLEYSGGLESTILLHALLKICPARLKLYHLTDSISAAGDDRQSAIQCAERYNCEITLFDMDQALPFDTKKSNKIMPSFPHSGLVNMAYQDFAHNLITKQKTTLINGSGGDSLFCSHPQKELVTELFLKGKFISAAIALKELSRYFRLPLLRTINQSAKSYANALNYLSDPIMFMRSEYGADAFLNVENLSNPTYNFPDNTISLENNDITTSGRAQNILFNKYEMLTSPISSVPGRYLYPFLSPETTAIALAIPSTLLTKEKHNRHYLRQAAFNRYGNESLWNTRKGGAMGLTQKAFLANRCNIEDLILNGVFVEKHIVDIDRTKKLIDGITIGATPCPHALIHLFTANIFIKYWEAYL